MPDKLYELIGSVMEVNPSQLDESSDYESVEKWDSMRQLMLASMLESEYGFTLTAEDMLRLQSIADIRAILAEHGVEGA